MKPTTELFDLIKSLNRNEKRYFKLHALMQKGTKQYLKLFDAIDSMDVYDEKSIKEKYRKESFVKNFTYNKNHLTRLIFKSLNFYSGEDSVESKLSNILKRCKIFFEKALIKEYFKTVQLGKALAKENEMFTYQLEFLEMERQLTPKEQIGKKNVQDIYDEEAEVISKMLRVNSVQRAVSELFVIQRKEGIVRSKNAENQVNKILSKLKYGMKQIDSSVALERYYFANYLAEEIKGNFTLSYKHNKKRFELISGKSGIFQKYIYDNKRTSLLSLIQSASMAKDFITAKVYLKKYENEFGRKGRPELRYDVTHLEYILAEALYKGKEPGKEILSNIEKVLFKFKGKINIAMYNLMYYNLSRYYFMKGEYEEALRIINILFENKFLKHTTNLEPYARILNMLIHYELKNYNLLSHLISANYKYFKSKNRLFKTEKIILNFLKKNSGRQVNSFKDLKKQFEILCKNKYERNAFQYFDFLKWINKKSADEKK